MIIIFNADDFGFSQSVNEAVLKIAQASQNVPVRFRASLMVNMPFAEQAVEQVVKHCPDLPLGLL